MLNRQKSCKEPEITSANKNILKRRGTALS